MNEQFILNGLTKNFDSDSHLDEPSFKMIVILGSLGDLDSFEYIQNIVKNLSKLRLLSINLYVISIGNNNSKNKFCSYVGIPRDLVQVVDNISIHQNLKLNEGLTMPVHSLANLILMCLGFSSPGTLKEVLRGYLGDKLSDQIFIENTRIKFGCLPAFQSSCFDIAGGTGFQRPFELASLRLLNMIEVLGSWNIYFPGNKYLTQRGGTFILDKSNDIIYQYRSTSLLSYSPEMRKPLSFIEKL